MTIDEQQRTTFETWAKSSPYYRSVKRYPESIAVDSYYHGQYLNPEVELAWQAWNRATFNGVKK